MPIPKVPSPTVPSPAPDKTIQQRAPRPWLPYNEDHFICPPSPPPVDYPPVFVNGQRVLRMEDFYIIAHNLEIDLPRD